MIQKLILRELRAGAVLEACDGLLCRQFRITRVRETARGREIRLTEVAGTLAVDPAVARYDELLRGGWERKPAVVQVCGEFRIKRRAFYYRLAHR